MLTIKEILQSYEAITEHQRGLSSATLTPLFSSLIDDCLELLSRFDMISLTSRIENKNYFSWVSDTGKKSRAVNMALFENLSAAKENKNLFFSALQNNAFSNIPVGNITKGCYAAAIAFCSTIDLLKERDQKTPGTFFEYFIGHCYARKFGIDPRNRVDVLNLEGQTTLPTDFIFDLGSNKPKFHLPVKTSTRERAIQVWAHQRVLDGVYGTGRFLGMLVALAETKLDVRNNIVTDICLPDQWKLYQLFIAQMKRIYYLDMPRRYAELNDSFPQIHVKPFGEFFREVDDLSGF